jgi:hypothetical protein
MSKVDRYLIHTDFWHGLFLALKMEATCSSETSVDYQWTMRRYISEDRTFLTDCLGSR